MQREVGITSFAKSGKGQAKCYKKRAKGYFGGFKKQKKWRDGEFSESNSEGMFKNVGESSKNCRKVYKNATFISNGGISVV